MSHHVRPRGARFELQVRHKLLPRKAFYATFSDASEADSYGQQLDAMLDRGIVPAELLAGEPRASDDPLLVAVVRGYINGAPHLTTSDDKLLGSMLGDLVGLRVSVVTYRWAGEWVRRLKVTDHLAPGTIRKRVGALARVLDWHLATAIKPGDTGAAPVNPLRLLPSGYSQYTEAEQRELAGKVAGGKALGARHDQRRDRRLLPDEEARLRQALAGIKHPDRERPWTGAADSGPDPAFDLFLSVIVDTGLRLREAYRLRVDQVDTVKGFIRVEGSKGARGQIKPRVVPLKRHLREQLATWCAGRVGLLWPYWAGTPEDLDPATRRLSARFATLFRYAEVPAMTEHDLRHEATCRWFELRDSAGRWVFSDVEVARIMGWSNLSMALRYASLRGEDLAARLG
jgi:integrase